MSGGGSSDVKETEGEKMIAAQVADMWNHYQTHLVPYEQKFMEEAQMQQADYNTASNFAGLGAESAYKELTAQPGMQRGGNLGVDVAEANLNKAGVKASNMVGAEFQTDDIHQQGVQAIVNAGRGQAVTAQNSMMQDASNNFRKAVNSAQTDYQEWSDRQSNLGSLAGMSLGAYENHQNKPKVPYEPKTRMV